MSNAKVRHRRRRRAQRRLAWSAQHWDRDDEYVPWDWYTMTDGGYGAGCHSGFDGQGEGY